MLRGNVKEGSPNLQLLGEGTFWRGAEAGMATGTKIERAPGTEPAPGT
jgi:hypothetical protein